MSDLLTPQEWLDRNFATAKKRPHVNSIRRWLESGDLPGRKIGGRWYVDGDAATLTTGNELVDRVLKAS